MRRTKAAAWVVLVVGLGLIVAPSIFGMWQRAPRGAQMISGFKPIMTVHNVPVIAGYGRVVLGGFGNSPAIVSEAAAHYSGGKVQLSYQQASQFLQTHGDLGALSYLQQQLPTLGPPFSTLLSVFYKDQPYFAGMVGLPNFSLFPYFFVLPGAILALGAALVLRRLAVAGRAEAGAGEAGGGGAGTGRATALDAARGARRPAWVVTVLGLLLVLAPFLPMPPGFHSIRTVGPHGATMLADFQAPVGDPGSNQAVMSLATVTQFDNYVSSMRSAAGEIVPAVEDAASVYGHQTITSAQALSFLAHDATLAQAYQLATGFAPMYAEFHLILTTMAKDMPDYRAVVALPSFRLFPYFFWIPGAIAALAGLVVLGGLRRIESAPSAMADPIGDGSDDPAGERAGGEAMGSGVATVD
jgi:hypothetical protein